MLALFVIWVVLWLISSVPEGRINASLVLSVISIVISCFAIFGKWRATHKQIEVQNLLQLSQYLHQTEYRDARHKVRTAKKGDLDPEALRKLCSSFDVAAFFVCKGLINKSIFLDYWGSLLVFLRDHISDDLKKPVFGELTGQQYYRHFYWLLEEAAKHPANFDAPID